MKKIGEVLERARPPARNPFNDGSPGRTVINPDTRICEVLAGLAAHHHKTWCFPTQQKLVELVKRFTGRVLCRRTLNRHLAGLERDGHIRRIRRHRAERGRGMTFHSTVYVIGGRYLARIRRIHEAVLRWLAIPDRATARLQSAIRVTGASQYARRVRAKVIARRGYPQAGGLDPG